MGQEYKTTTTAPGRKACRETGGEMRELAALAVRDYRNLER